MKLFLILTFFLNSFNLFAQVHENYYSEQSSEGTSGKDSIINVSSRATTIAPSESLGCLFQGGIGDPIYGQHCSSMVLSSTLEILITSALLKELKAAQVDAIAYMEGEEASLQLKAAADSLQEASRLQEIELDFDEACFEIANIIF